MCDCLSSGTRRQSSADSPQGIACGRAWNWFRTEEAPMVCLLCRSPGSFPALLLSCAVTVAHWAFFAVASYFLLCSGEWLAFFLCCFIFSSSSFFARKELSPSMWLSTGDAGQDEQKEGGGTSVTSSLHARGGRCPPVPGPRSKKRRAKKREQGRPYRCALPNTTTGVVPKVRSRSRGGPRSAPPRSPRRAGWMSP